MPKSRIFSIVNVTEETKSFSSVVENSDCRILIFFIGKFIAIHMYTETTKY